MSEIETVFKDLIDTNVLRGNYAINTVKALMYNSFKEAFIFQGSKIDKLKEENKELEAKIDSMGDMNFELIQKLKEENKVLRESLKEAYELIRSTGYTIENDKRCMDGNEYVWIDRALFIMKEALSRIKGE